MNITSMLRRAHFFTIKGEAVFNAALRTHTEYNMMQNIHIGKHPCCLLLQKCNKGNQADVIKNKINVCNNGVGLFLYYQSG
jgi:hypothetical protein